MVCTSEEATAECVVQDTIMNSPKPKLISVRPSTYVHQLINDVATQYNYEEDKFQLIYHPMRGGDHTVVVLNDEKQKTLGDIGIDFEEGAKNMLCIAAVNQPKYSPRRKAAIVTENSEDDLLLGASASPTLDDLLPPLRMPCIGDSVAGSSSNSYNNSLIKRGSIGYVGLVNQAMTCYLNSLLQALFMTPEFRNALYNWEFDGKDEVDSIPYQLQKLFLNLQTSTKAAVETTELTRSFGWDSSEAWQQHDIQELCRVMFDALEQKFKNTKQADLINRLYEGKLFDYVKCLECGTEKSREDTFLDIPLPVRPFGSTIAYGSIEEALRAFVKPETLEGSNQYFCEKCNKKCDAHKGLKFTKFPYLLTLHLKRFDFDYSTLHRIKLNDKVVFPETLNLNSFITNGLKKEETDLDEVVVKCDDSSTTDSGSALDEDNYQSTDVIGSNSNNQLSFNYRNLDIDYPDYDEGIDVSEGTSNNHQENEKNKRHAAEPGPYMYELFSIMIHSGSASGGHYYAYIKDFKKGEWFCFNDQSVTKITYDDIRKTYGGGGHMRGYYSGAFSSSTNAYMLMYRQIDKERNCDAITIDTFPPHIQELYEKIKAKEDRERVCREKESKLCKLKVYARHPTTDEIIDGKLYIFRDTTLTDATRLVRTHLQLDGLIPLEQCRLVSYDRVQDTIECSFEGKEDEPIGEILSNGWRRTCKTEFLLEMRQKDEEFEKYQPGTLFLKVFMVDIETEVVEGPVVIRGNQSQSVKELKKLVAKKLDLDVNTLKLAVEKYSGRPRILEDSRTLESEGIYSSSKLYAAKALDLNPNKPFIVSKFNQIIDQYEHVISLQIVLPEVSDEILESLGIPKLDLTQQATDNVQPEKPPTEKLPVENPPTEKPSELEVNVCNETATPIIPSVAGPITVNMSDSPILQRGSPLPVEVGSDQSNSEDSSLSDSDRTLVGDVPDDEGLAQLSVSSTSPCVSSPDEAKKVEDTWDDLQLVQTYLNKKIHYFKATELITENKQNKKTRILKILIDNRMSLSQVKKELEPHVGVPMDYFKVFRHYLTAQETECVRLTEDFDKSYSEGEKIGIKLGRALRNGEYQGKVYQLVPDDPEPIKYLCDWIVAKGTTVAEIRKGIHEELKRKNLLDVPFDRFRLRKKNWKYPGKVYLDDETLDIVLSTNWEIFVQELSEPETVHNSNQIIIFVRHWCPSTMELKGFKEIVLDKGTTEEFKERLSAMSGIPVECLEICETKKSFPNELSVLNLHIDPDWTSQKAATGKWTDDYYDDGQVFLYRDSREQLKELTPEERKELSQRETARICRLRDKVSIYSPRRERGLKIYLDSNKKDEDKSFTESEQKTTDKV
ncbi:ubiquitin carboxyl-terminal hydrolase 47 isoform X2 [Chrysoperla carnea]|nr:ubiquitin carboxyl-terminal hydrolase 47 isoform X2 [Chrysoperla carnea]